MPCAGKGGRVSPNERTPDALEPMDKARQSWLREEKRAMCNPSPGLELGYAKRGFAAGFAAGVAHAKTEGELCDQCFQRSIVTYLPDESLPEAHACRHHFPSTVRVTRHAE